MKVLRKILAYFVLCVCTIAHALSFTVFSYIFKQLDVVPLTIIMTGISCVACAIIGFYIPQLISYSKKGLRYSIVSVIHIIIGIAIVIYTVILSIMTTAVPFYYYILLIFPAFLNYSLIYGITMLILYRKNYKKLK